MDFAAVVDENTVVIKRRENNEKRAYVFCRSARPEGRGETKESIKQLPGDVRTHDMRSIIYAFVVKHIH